MSKSANACPICGKPRDPAHTPFCSQGCRDRDLIQWLDGGYVAPALPDEDEAESLGLDKGHLG